MHDFQIYILIYFCLFNLVTAEEVVLQYPQIKVYLSVSSCSSSHFLFINFWGRVNSNKGLPQWLTIKNPVAMQELQETWVWSLDQGDSLQEATATHSSILAWRIPRTEEPGGLQSIGLQKVGHDWSSLACIQ